MATELENLVVRISADTQQIRSELARAQRSTSGFERGTVASLKKVQAAAVGLAGSLGLGLLVKSSAEAALAFQRFESGLRAATGSATQAQREMKFIRDESQRLGIRVEDAAGSFTKLAAAARGTALQGKEARAIFSSVAEASRVLGLTTEQTGGALTAIEQIISKGKVSAEELRGQLGERLPGAFQIAARSMDVTTQKLDEMLSNGELMAEDFLPRFAKELRRTFADELPNAVQRADAEFARFSNAMTDLKVSVGENVLPEMSRFAQFMADDFIPAIRHAAEQVGLLDRNLRSMSEGELRLRQQELIEGLKEIDAAWANAKSQNTADRMQSMRNEAEQELFAINKLLAAYDERNEKVVKYGRDAVDAEAAATEGANKTAGAVAEVSKEYAKERDRLLEKLATVEDNTEAARVLYETTEGGLKAIAPAQKAELQRLAERLDLEQDTADVREYLRDQERERAREWEQEQRRQHVAEQRELERQTQDRLRELQRRAEREAEILLQPFKNASDNIQDEFTSMFEGLFRGSIDSFKDFAGAIKDIFIRLAAEVATLLVFRPILGSLVGAGGLTGLIASAGTAGGAGGGLAGATSLISGGGFGGGLAQGGSVLSSLVGGFQSPALAGFGIGVADKLGLGAFGQSALAGAGLNAPFGLIGGIGANLLGLGGGLGGTLGGTAGSLLGGGLGSALAPALSFAGPLGAVAGGFLGSALGGLFGGKPSRDVSAATIEQRGGKFVVRSRGGNGSNMAARGIGQQLAAQLNAYVAAGNKLNFSGGVGITQVENPGETGVKSPFLLDFVAGPLKQGGFGSRKAFGSAGDLISAVLGQVQKFGTKETAADRAAKNAQREQTEAAKESARAFLRAANPINRFSEGVRTLIEQFRDLRANAKELGLRWRSVVLTEQAALRGTLGGLLDQRRQTLGIAGLESLQQDLSFGSLSPFSSVQRFNAGKAALDSLTGRALSGDPEALQAFPGLAQEVLGLGRDAFASGPQYAEVFGQVNATLNQVIARQKSIEDSLLAGLDITIRETSQDQIAAQDKAIRLVVKELKDIRQALRRAA